MNVAFGAIQRCGNLPERNAIGTEDAAGLAGLQLRVARSFQEWTNPPRLQLRAAFNEQIGPVKPNDKARFGIDEVRVFRGFGQRNEVNLIATDFLNDRAKVRGRGNNTELGLGVDRECGGKKWDENL